MATLAVSRETTWITEPLRADGTPDYGAWIASRYARGVTPANNAAPALLAIEMEAAAAGFPATFAEQERRALRAPWDESDAPLIAHWLARNTARLARAAEIVRSRPRFWVPRSPEMSMDERIPSHLGLRLLANGFRARALQRLYAGDGEGARGDLLTGLRLAARIDQGPWLIDRLVGVAVRGIAAEPVAALANPPPAGRAEAAALLAGLRAVPPSSPLDEVLEGSERIQFLAGYVDLYRAARRSPEEWGERVAAVTGGDASLYAAIGRKPPPASLRRIPAWAIDWNALLRRINECWLAPGCDAGFAAGARDLESPAFEQLLDDARTQPAARERMARAFLTLATPTALVLARVSWNEQQAVARAGLVSAAAALWHVDHGRYPESSAGLASGPSSAGFDPASEHASYAFRYTVSKDGRAFAYTGAPLPSAPGARGFCADSAGRLAAARDAIDPTVDGACAPGLVTLVARTATP